MTSHEVYDDTASKDEKEAWQAKDEMRQMIHWLDEIKRVDRLIRQAATCVVGRHFLFYTQRVPQRITRVADVPSDLHG